MEFVFRRSYRGPVKLTIFDWAGTMIDYGSCAPAGAFIEGYRRKGLEITMAQARAPMGMGKWDHIKVIGQMEPVAAQWQQIYNRELNNADVDEMYEDFVPVLLEVLADYAILIPGAVEMAKALKKDGILLGGTTGYFEEAMNVCVKAAARQGYAPDFCVCATQVSAGRPAPWMIYRVMNELNVYPPEAVVKVGDTEPDIEAGLNAGVWTVGVVKTGNALGLNEAEVSNLPPVDVQTRLAQARIRMGHSGAHYVVDGVWDVPAVVADINTRLTRGERP